MATHTITFSGHPHRLNESVGRHWSVKARQKAADRLAVLSAFSAAMLNDGATFARGKRRVTLTLHLGPRQRGGDVDAYWKGVLDALTHCGAVLGDRADQVEIAPLRLVKSEDGRKRTVITLEDLE